MVGCFCGSFSCYWWVKAKRFLVWMPLLTLFVVQASNLLYILVLLNAASNANNI